jgi:nucleoid DNA-binding protein
VNRSDIIDRITLNMPELTQRQARQCLNLVFETIQEAVFAGENVTLMRFGTFYLKTFHKTNSINPKTGEPIQTSPKQKIAFSHSKSDSVILL